MVWIGSAVVVLVTATLCAAVDTSPQDDLSCGVTRGSLLGPSDLRSCIPAAGSLRICQEVLDEERADFVVREGKREVQRWRDNTPGSFPKVFQVVAADLDGDAVDDMAVAIRDTVSNGLAVEYWTICAINGKAPESPPACVGVEDYGSLGYFTKRAGSPGCLLLQTAWRRGEEPGDGPGLYLVGRWLRYAKAGFVPDPSRPTMARRFLHSFAQELGSHVVDAPLGWFRDRRTKTVTCPDPLCE